MAPKKAIKQKEVVKEVALEKEQSVELEEDKVTMPVYGDTVCKLDDGTSHQWGVLLSNVKGRDVSRIAIAPGETNPDAGDYRAIKRSALHRVAPRPTVMPYSEVISWQVWSNDKYESVEHRVVVNDKKERFSVPFFFNPSHSVMVGPVPELVNEENPPRYKEYNWGKFLKRRRDSNFKNLGTENLQIHDFYISQNSS